LAERAIRDALNRNRVPLEPARSLLGSALGVLHVEPAGVEGAAYPLRRGSQPQRTHPRGGGSAARRDVSHVEGSVTEGTSCDVQTRAGPLRTAQRTGAVQVVGPETGASRRSRWHSDSEGANTAGKPRRPLGLAPASLEPTASGAAPCVHEACKSRDSSGGDERHSHPDRGNRRQPKPRDVGRTRRRASTAG
jgi:hypothetical protein